MADILAASKSTVADGAKRRKVSSVAGLSAPVCDMLRTETLHVAASSGVLLGADGPFNHAPCSLLPYPLPATVFSHALSLSQPFSVLVDRVSRDTEWLGRVVRTTVGHDPFTRRLLDIFDEVNTKGVAQPLQLNINRSDYMVDQPTAEATPRILQVELNTVAASFASLSTKMIELHRHTVTRLGATLDAASRAEILRTQPAVEGAFDAGTAVEVERFLPTNGALANVAAALALSHQEYAKLVGGGDPSRKLAVVMIVTPSEANVIDQRGIEAQLWKEHRVPLIRASLADVHARGRLGERSRFFLGIALGGEVEISTVYLRAGYAPGDYTGELDWQARTLIEHSYAIKCPSVAQQLAGTKKVQQVLAKPAEIERFMSAAESLTLRESFAGLYGLEADGGAEVDAIVAKAIASPHRFVLKPQREGGGNNLYGDELAEALRTMSAAERASFILMERIVPPSKPMLLMREGVLDGGGCTCELGVYGAILADQSRVLLNQCAGHLLRVKLDNVNEGGVCAGFAVLSSPILTH